MTSNMCHQAHEGSRTPSTTGLAEWHEDTSEAQIMTSVSKITRLLPLAALLGIAGANPRGRGGVPPQDVWSCSPSHPIKGNFTTYSGEPCIYHIPGGRLYPKTKPERCYVTEDDAQQDGCRRSKR
jgi:hypothetical protein